MKEYDIEQLIATEQRRRQEADREHLQQLAREQGADLGHWCAQRRTVVRAVAMVVLVAIPSVYAMLLPQREAEHVLCNRSGEEMLVLNRACGALGNCEKQHMNDYMLTMEKEIM